MIIGLENQFSVFLHRLYCIVLLQGQTAFDVADTETIKLLEELKLKQASVSDSQSRFEILILSYFLYNSKTCLKWPLKNGQNKCIKDKW